MSKSAAKKIGYDVDDALEDILHELKKAGERLAYPTPSSQAIVNSCMGVGADMDQPRAAKAARTTTVGM